MYKRQYLGPIAKVAVVQHLDPHARVVLAQRLRLRIRQHAQMQAVFRPVVHHHAL